MRLLFNADEGEIYYAVPERDWFWFAHTTNIPLSEFDIDEINPENRDICMDLRRVAGKKDQEGRGKYYISGCVLHVKEGWQECQLEII
ncbi:MAG: hypothetical protein K8I01_09660 [Candidatus Methylomirabilis sp.]|nr:hypothetical protein [Deltaproteobacteria bacterium]